MPIVALSTRVKMYLMENVGVSFRPAIEKDPFHLDHLPRNFRTACQIKRYYFLTLYSSLQSNLTICRGLILFRDQILRPTVQNSEYAPFC